MDAFSAAIEKMAHLPAKGSMPTKEDVAKVAEVAKSFAASPKDPVTGRQAPTQAEVAAIVAAMKQKS